MHKSSLLAFALLTACAAGQSGTDQSDVGRKTDTDVDSGTPEGEPEPVASPDGGTVNPEDEPNGDLGSLPDCATTDIALTPAQFASSIGTSRWQFSACVVAPDYGPLNGDDLELTFSGVVRDVAVMALEEWIPEAGCSRSDPSVVVLGEPLAPYAGTTDNRVGSALRLDTDEGRQVELVLSAPDYCFAHDPRLDRAPPHGECPLWSYRIVEGKRVTLVLSSRQTSGVPAVTLELRGDDERRELWLQQAPDAHDLSLPNGDAALGAAECSTVSACGEPVAQHALELMIGGTSAVVGSGGSVVVDDQYVLNAGTTRAPFDSCSAALTSSVVLSWPACHDVVQRVDGEIESVGYHSCAGDEFPSQYFVSDRAEACVATTYVDYSTLCESEVDCEGDPCDFYCMRPSLCFTDDDCSAGEVCVCQGMYGEDGNGALGANVCLPSECESRADCDGLPCAIGYNGFWAGSLEGVFCHTPEDDCTTASDCGSNEYCRYRKEQTRWVCEGINQP